MSCTGKSVILPLSWEEAGREEGTLGSLSQIHTKLKGEERRAGKNSWKIIV